MEAKLVLEAQLEASHELPTRNNALVFAKRTLKNLDYIEKASKRGRDVHPITQAGCSLLGMIVFPRERNLDATVSSKQLSDLGSEGWPSWQYSQAPSDTLGDLVRHLRNAVAHGHIVFSSDSSSADDVYVEASDYKRNTQVPIWHASILASDLRLFCIKYIELLEGAIE